MNSCLVLAALALSPAFCSAAAKPQSPSTPSGAVTVQADPAAKLADAPLAATRAELLRLAFEAASAMPVNPHIKSRSKSQELAVTTCVELSQAKTAFAFSERIENWRRGAAFAELALHCVRNGGDAAVTDRLIDLAYAEAEAPAEELGQDWRRDRIRSKIAQALMLRGEVETAAIFKAGLEDAEAGKLAAFEAGLMPDERFDGFLSVLEHGVAAGNFDMTLYAMSAVREMYRRFYSDAERRATLESKLEVLWVKSPIALRAETLLSFAQTAADNADKSNGVALLERAAKIVDGANWTAQEFAGVMGATARCQKTLGQADAARASLRRAEDKFAAERESIWNFERAAVLRPIALAQAAIGDSAAALATFRRAFDDGAENPNGRPRAEDLTATCCALAQSGLEPGEELMKRVREIRAGLKAPW
jgi:hypothetical protein